MRRHANVFAILFGFVLLMGAPAMALPESFTGTLATDDEVDLVTFDVDAAMTVTLRTFGYAGGTQQNGNVVPAGGFDPVLNLFDGTGALIAGNDDGRDEPGFCAVPSDSDTGLGLDSCLVVSLAAGSYTVSVTQYDNFPMGDDLSDGFDFTDSPNFTADNSCSNGQFCDVHGNNRTNAWALDVTGGSVVPEPSSAALLVAGAGGLAWLGRRRPPAA